MLSIGSLVLGVDDMERAARFWTRALGYEPRDGAVDATFTVLVPAAEGAGAQLALMPSETAPDRYPRLHLDLYAADAAEQAAEVERLLAIGAERVDWDRYPEDPDFVVLADPEGNRFCVIDTSHG
ncbi:VOC family protein [Streptomyces huiliensis]|uniref:VOC family protein n=1 Tax=Streptomyces huiliensis TaxID=2876027 RepID=UPI001CBFCEF5|nr:VOC family protein [Streptomyces huiliensis]MBZ4321652.1 VOC family protein [Streptomyces huiliensis]